jgi:hypothetical protein
VVNCRPARARPVWRWSVASARRLGLRRSRRRCRAPTRAIAVRPRNGSSRANICSRLRWHSGGKNRRAADTPVAVVSCASEGPSSTTSRAAVGNEVRKCGSPGLISMLALGARVSAACLASGGGRPSNRRLTPFGSTSTMSYQCRVDAGFLPQAIALAVSPRRKGSPVLVRSDSSRTDARSFKPRLVLLRTCSSPSSR